MKISGHQIKLIVWDLDETFWRGTLAEGETIELDDRVHLVRNLAHRGVLSSICSKNHRLDAKAVLEKAGIWDFFVFKKISLNPKGAAVSQTLEDAGLRADNVLFLDDETRNRNEVIYANRGIKTGTYSEFETVFQTFVSENEKTDPELKRLSNYRDLETKKGAQAESLESNENFLRNSEIKISINRDVEGSLDRILELLQRTNQLNFTKIRIGESEEEQFLESLDHFQSSCGLISCRDSYCDYGEIGFYQLMTSRNGKRLKHFVFSCRVMNMGVESFVYELLGRPKVNINGPTAYLIDAYRQCDWITLERDPFSSKFTNRRSNSSTLLLGPCNLLQVSNYIEDPKSEFLHYERDGTSIKFDCPGFFLADSRKVRESEFLDSSLGVWTKEEFAKFHNELKEADCIVLDILDVLQSGHIAEVDGIFFRCDPTMHQSTDSLVIRSCDLNERATWAEEMITHVEREAKEGCRIIILNRLVHPELSVGQLSHRLACEVCVRRIVSSSEKIELMDLNTFSKFGIHEDGIHLSRKGYHELAKSIVNGASTLNDIDLSLFSILGRRSAKEHSRDPDVLKEMAMEFEREGNIKMACVLMEKALSLRPYAKFMMTKIASYKKSLNG